MNASEKVTVPRLTAMKKAGRRIVMLTCYDFLTAALLDECGVDCLLVGDSVALLQGRETTIPVTLDQIVYHAEMVARGAKRALVVCDLPFGTFQQGKQAALASACRVLKEANCPAVKMETSLANMDVVSALTEVGVPVMAHIGLRPQSIHSFGVYRVQRDVDLLVQEAEAAQAAGAFAIVVECVPSEAARQVTAAVAIPTIGIGAGPECDGQVLVTPDLLGLTPGRLPKFSKPYLDLRSLVRSAVGSYAEEVRSGAFPGPEHSYQ